jgi:hypothetical protein
MVSAAFSGHKLLKNVLHTIQSWQDSIEYIFMTLIKQEEIIARLNIVNNKCDYTVDNFISYDTLTTIINKKMMTIGLGLLPEINNLISHQLLLLYLSL